MRQRWAHLLFLHWEVEPEQLRLLLPPGLQLDTFNGRAFVGLVPFTMTGVRPWWAPPIRPISDFHETNVRTYVHRNESEPGVWFFSLDAACSLAVRIARGMWKLPYHRAKMRLHERLFESSLNEHVWLALQSKMESESPDAEQPTFQRESLEIEYESERLWPGPLPARCAVQYSTASAPTEAVPGTLEHFLIERYLLYAFRNGTLYMGQVHHEHYPVQHASVQYLSENLVSAAGIVHSDEAPLAHYASEVNVRIYPLREVDGER